MPASAPRARRRGDTAMNISPRATVRNDHHDPDRTRRGFSNEARFVQRASDDEVEAVMASLSYLLDGGERAPKPAPGAPDQAPAPISDGNVIDVDEGWLEPAQPEVTESTLGNRHTLATLRP